MAIRGHRVDDLAEEHHVEGLGEGDRVDLQVFAEVGLCSRGGEVVGAASTADTGLRQP